MDWHTPGESFESLSIDEPEPPKTVTVFKLPDHTIDTRLTVFTKVYHVHSIILKLHSRFFRTFLDSADKVPALSYATFKYDWISVVDEDGEWGLEAIRDDVAHQKEKNSLDPSRCIEHEEEAFEVLLNAMYSKRYNIKNLDGLENATRLADFYCVLPILSSTLDSALLSTDGANIIGEITTNPERVLHIAHILRHQTLFKEAFVHTTGRWKTSGQTEEERQSFAPSNSRLRNLISREYDKIDRLVVEANDAIRELYEGSEYFQDFIHCYCPMTPNGTKILRLAGYWHTNPPDNEEDMRSAYRYRCLRYEWVDGKGDHGWARGASEDLDVNDFDRDLVAPKALRLELALNDLLVDNTRLGGLAPNRRSWDSAYEDVVWSHSSPITSDFFFRCALISDEDLPWDVEQDDW